MPCQALRLSSHSLSVLVIILLLLFSCLESFSMLPTLRRVHSPSCLLRRSKQKQVGSLEFTKKVFFSTYMSSVQTEIGDPTCSTKTTKKPSPSQPVVVYATVDPEILEFLELNKSNRKTRILVSSKITSTFRSIRSAIENKFKALADRPYKLRYRLSHHENSDLQALRGDEDVSKVMSAAQDLRSSVQLFVQVNPGIFPPTAGLAKSTSTQCNPDGDVVSAARFASSVSIVHGPSVDAMRAAHIDPADSEDYTMISFYGFHDIASPSDFATQLEALWKPFHALGRVYVAKEGVNAQMAVPSSALPFFSSATRSLEMFHTLRINTDHTVSRAVFEKTRPFRALHVRAREQILSDGFGEEASSGLDWSRAGQEMPPLEWHRRLSLGASASAKASASAADLEVRPVVLDCRNSYESEVGLFEGAVPLNTTFFRESWPVLEALLKDTPRDAPILTYCTGGIRCVKVNAYLQQKMGFTNTHRLQGGIIAYNRELDALKETQKQKPDSASESEDASIVPVQSKFRGLNYVFDERIAARITEDVLTMCELCAEPCDQFTNCANYLCNVRFIQCLKCNGNYGGCCSKACQNQRSRSSEASSGSGATGQAQRSSLLTRSAQRKAAAMQLSAADEGEEGARAAKKESSPLPQAKIEHAFNSALGIASADPTAGVQMMEALAQYCESQSEQESPLLSRLREETMAHYAGSPGATRMLCDPLQGRLLALLATLIQAKSVLELGAFTGYSAICLAEGMQSGGETRPERRVISCEPDAEARAIAQKFIAEGGLQDVIDLRADKAMTVIEALRADPTRPLLDLVFLDADKKQYMQYMLALMGMENVDNVDDVVGRGNLHSRPLLRDGALIVVDNTLWKGLVLEVARHADAGKERESSRSEQSRGVTPRMRALAESMHQFNSFISTEPRLQQVMLPIRDGLSIIRYVAP